MTSDSLEDDRALLSFQPAAFKVAGLALIVLLIGSALLYGILRKPAGPPPARIANDPLLVKGRELYLDRCVSCHGAEGKGNGPIAKGLSGPPVRDLTLPKWKHGDSAEQALAVIAHGVPNAAMAGWKGTFGPEGVRAVTAYVFFLAGREIPAELRTP